MKTRILCIVVFVIFVFAGVAAAQQFVVAPRMAAGYGQYSADADFNGDGRRDLALWGFQSSGQIAVLTVLLGTGDGNFTQAQQIKLASVSPHAIVAGDWNGDGIPDLALGENFPNGVAIYLGVGDGTFAAGSQLSVNDNILYGLAQGDLNGDGIADLIMSNYEPSVTVLLGQGGGTFGSPTNYDLGNQGQTNDVIVADFNGDGKQDVAVAQPEQPLSGSVAILLGNGDGSLQAAVSYSAGDGGTTHLVSGDFNRDGIPDIATGGVFVLGVLLGNGDGTFQAAQTYAEIHDSGPLEVADVNGDGNPDVLALTMGYAPVGIVTFLGNGDGSFQSGQLFGSSGVSAVSVAVADFNGDGTIDAVTSDFDDSYISFLAGHGDGSFVTWRGFQIVGLEQQDGNRDAYVTSLAVAYLDSPNLDVAFLDYDYSQVIVVRGGKDGTFQGHLAFDTGSGAETIAAADFNGDGYVDLVTDSSSGNGTARFPKHVDYPGSTGEIFVATGDVSGDGKVDVIAVNQNARTVTVYLNDGTGKFNTHVDTSMTNEPLQVATGDFNQDGKLDVVTANAGDLHAATILLGNGDGTFTIGDTFATKNVVGSGVRGVVVADFNQDGNLDFAISSASSVFVFLGHGDGTFGNFVETPGVYLYGIRAGDFNRDRKPDMVGVAGGEQYLLTGKGDGTFTVTDYGTVDGYVEGVGDFNHDGALDVVNAGGSDGMTVLLNTGAKP
ncbi:MAG: VCBS repeat-containing protein [Acidobacteriales bacterium]|nr:VCBS repeat-containing protein [Terriglobales bacterium]